MSQPKWWNPPGRTPQSWQRVAASPAEHGVVGRGSFVALPCLDEPSAAPAARSISWLQSRHITMAGACRRGVTGKPGRGKPVTGERGCADGDGVATRAHVAHPARRWSTAGSREPACGTSRGAAAGSTVHLEAALHVHEARGPRSRTGRSAVAHDLAACPPRATRRWRPSSPPTRARRPCRRRRSRSPAEATAPALGSGHAARTRQRPRHRLRADRGGPTVGDHPRRSLQQGRRRDPRARRGTRRARQPGADLGPAQLRRVRRVLHRRVGVDHAGRHPRRADRAPRPRADGDHRRLGRRARLDAHRRPSPRARRRPRHVVDQRRPVRADEPGGALLRAEPRRRVDRRHGRGRRAPRVGGAASSATRRTASASSTRTARSSCARWNAGCSCTTRATTSSCPASPTTTPRASPCRRSCSAAARATRAHTRATSEAVAAGLPNARLVEPPWGDREWLDRSAKHRTGEAPLFTGWPALAPPLLAWADEALA